MDLRRYRKRPDEYVIAVQLDLVTDGFTYEKWGAEQTCKAGDWVVDNAGDVYTIDGEAFARTYRRIGPGQYAKTTPVWARVAEKPGQVETLEGVTHYQAGDYLVFNREDGGDPYAISAAKFEAMYEPAPEGD